MKRIGHFIAGKRDPGAGTRAGDITNPATGEVSGSVAFATAADVDRAVAAATAALPGWSATPPVRRAGILFKFRELIVKHGDELARIITLEHGKVLADAKGSLTRGLEVVEFACGIPQMLKGEFSENVGTAVDSWGFRQPVGVCAGITPFNFPAMVPMWMFPVAIACGNTFVLKPSEKVPSCAMRLAELFIEAGGPPGVLNVVHGDKEAVDAILHHPGIAAVSFVGSTPIAEYVHHTASAAGKRVQALGGAKNHMMVMPDADLDQATDALMGAAFGSAGERCMAVSVALAVGDVADKLIPRLKDKMARLKVGPGTDTDSEMGPLVSKAHYEKVKGYVDLGVKEGADLVVDGRGLHLQGYEKGYFLGPCLFDKVQPTMRIYKEEIFGPVLAMVRVADFAAGAKLINDHEFGNGTAIFTRDGDAAREFAASIQVGMVGINVPIPVPMAFHSFGGWKRSIFSDHAMHGPEGVRFYTKLKTVTARWPTGIRAGAEYTMPVAR
ncbi:MAG: CoA-acylating methylmalonate-semialdehyde dehydrogenase [Alphaproteobacteria bacterium]|nr:CoA-acylating methylmalonate-semialdehyde dehydrogenase [Alphaproteobacteria bacterium]